MCTGEIHPITIPYCPVCEEPIDLAGYSRSAKFTGPFWGEPPSRRLKCRLGAHMHFTVSSADGKGISHRYAYLAPYAKPER
jgi:hypothetical protein